MPVAIKASWPNRSGVKRGVCALRVPRINEPPPVSGRESIEVDVAIFGDKELESFLAEFADP